MIRFAKIVALAASCLVAGGSISLAKSVLKFHHDLPEDSAQHVAAEKFRDLVAERTKGNIEVRIFPNNALGDGVSANPEGPLLTRFPYLLPPNQGNQPRMSNQQIADTKPARDWTKPPVVDENGKLK